MGATVEVDAEGMWRLQTGGLDMPRPPDRIDADPTLTVLAQAVAA